MTNFFHSSSTSCPLHPLNVKNYQSISRTVVDEGLDAKAFKDVELDGIGETISIFSLNAVVHMTIRTGERAAGKHTQIM